MLLPFLGAATGSLLLIHSGTLLIPVWTSFMDHDGQLTTLVALLLAEAAAGLLLWTTFRGLEGRLRTRDGFVLVTFTWVVVSALGTLPLILCLDMSVTNAVFESVSGVTTTGATVLTGLDDMPRSVLFYRQELQWLGGVGVVVLAIALFPMLRIGGMQLLKAETPGPVKSEKLRPRLRETARSLWLVYILLTAGCALFFWISGMSFFDAVAHSLSTVSTGGFSTHDASLGFFNSQAVELTAIVFMILASINFSLHYITLHQFSLSHYFSNEEVRALIGVIAVVIGVVSLMLFQQGVTTTIGPALRHAAFQVVSVITSTGFATRDFTTWPLFVPVLLIFISFIGGCAGSTAGGMKVMRFVVLGKQAAVEVHRLYHPHLIKEVRLGGRTVPPSIVQAIWAYCAIYVLVFAVTMVVLMFDGMDQVTAFGAVATCLNNLGPGLGEVAQNFINTSASEKWLLSIAMLLGRLELFTIFVLFMPSFWRE